MAKYQYLLKKNNTSSYYFRSVVPKYLQNKLQTKEFQLSLRTGLLTEALHISQRLNFLTKKIFSKMQNSKEDMFLNREDIKKILKEEIKRIRKATETDRIKIGFDDEERKKELEWTEQLYENFKLGLEQKDNKFDWFIEKRIESYTKDFQIDFNNLNQNYSLLRFNIIKLVMLEFEYKISLLKNEKDSAFDIAKELHDELAEELIKKSNFEDSVSNNQISKVLKIFIKERFNANSINIKTKKTYEYILNEFKDYFNDKSINCITKEDAIAFKAYLKTLNSNRKKSKNPNLTKKIISTSTINNYIGTTSSFFEWCLSNNFVEKNYFIGLKIKERIRNDEKRDCFTEEDLTKLFNKQDYFKFTIFKKKYDYFWIPLIALFTGARLTEICQLYISDIKKENQIWYFDINEDTDDKSLKTISSTRKIPIHNTLIKIGLIDYVNLLKSKNIKRLFPSLKNGSGGYKKNISRYFNEKILKDLKIKRDKINFHSFRHNVATHLKFKNINKNFVAELLGHKIDDETFGTYGKRLKLEILKEECIDNLNYEYLNFDDYHIDII